MLRLGHVKVKAAEEVHKAICYGMLIKAQKLTLSHCRKRPC